MDYTVHGIHQARILEWVAFPFSRGSSQLRDRTSSPALQADSLPLAPTGKPMALLSLVIIQYKDSQGGSLEVLVGLQRDSRANFSCWI